MTQQVPWQDLPLHMLSCVSTSDDFSFVQEVVARWLEGRGRTPSSARIKDVIEFRNILTTNPPLCQARLLNKEKAPAADLLTRIDKVISKLSDIPISRFVTSCIIELGGQLWVVMNCCDQLHDLLGVEDDADLDMMRECVLGVNSRCCGLPQTEQFRLMTEQLITGGSILERITTKLATAIYAKEKREGHKIPVTGATDAAFDVPINPDGSPN